MFDLNKIADLVKDVEGLAKNLPLEQIFTNEFMSSNTKFKTIEEFLGKAGIDISSLLGASSSKDANLNGFIDKNSNFGNWGEMYSAAISLLAAKK